MLDSHATISSHLYRALAGSKIVVNRYYQATGLHMQGTTRKYRHLLSIDDGFLPLSSHVGSGSFKMVFCVLFSLGFNSNTSASTKGEGAIKS